MAKRRMENGSDTPPTGLQVTAEMPPKLAYTIQEFCEAVGLSKGMIYKEIRAERLKIKKVGARTLVPIEAAQAWMKL